MYHHYYHYGGRPPVARGGRTRPRVLRLPLHQSLSTWHRFLLSEEFAVREVTVGTVGGILLRVLPACLRVFVHLGQKLLVILGRAGSVVLADGEGRHAADRAPTLGSVDVPQPNPGGGQLVIDLIHKVVKVRGPPRRYQNPLSLVVKLIRLVVDVDELGRWLFGQLLPPRHRVNV